MKRSGLKRLQCRAAFLVLSARNLFVAAVVLASALTFAVVLAGPAQAGEVPWRSPIYTHVAHDAPLSAVLRDFAANQGIIAVLSPKVVGMVNGSFVDLAPRQFLDRMCMAYGLTWYYDGSALYIYAADELTSEVISLRFITPTHLRSVLQGLDMWDGRFGWKALDDMGVVYLSGPQRYVQLVSKTAALVDLQAEQKGDFDVVKVFPLKYAWADDVTFEFMNDSIQVPGVVTVLRNLLAGRSAPGLIDGKTQKTLSSTVGKLKGKGLAAQKKQAEEDANADPGGASQSLSANIMADARLNAVIVRDVRQKMPYYEELIKAVDVPTGLVQIDAVIVDVSTDYLRTLGVQWRFESGNTGSAAKGYGGFGATEGFLSSATDLAVGEGLALSTVLERNGEFFMARINALQEDGDAHVLTRSSVLTVNNMEAQLERTETFYVRVQGDQEVDLFDVSSGIVLRVQPHIIYDTPNTKIKLTVTIEDGSPLDTSVDDVPRVQKSTVNTQAVVKAGQSLLIGGFWVDSKSDTVEKIPLLGDIPLIGMLFRNTRKVDTKMERMFLISPRIVDLDNVAGEQQPTTTIDPEQDPARIGLGVSKGLPAMGEAAPALPPPVNMPRRMAPQSPDVPWSDPPGSRSSIAPDGSGPDGSTPGDSGSDGPGSPNMGLGAVGAAAPQGGGDVVSSTGPMDTVSQTQSPGSGFGPDGARWLVQVAAYPAAPEARETARILERKGYPVYMEPVRQGGREIFVVHLGGFDSRPEARAMADRFYAAEGRRPFLRVQRAPGASPVSMGRAMPAASGPVAPSEPYETSAPVATQAIGGSQGGGSRPGTLPTPGLAALSGLDEQEQPSRTQGQFQLAPPRERQLSEADVSPFPPAMPAPGPATAPAAGTSVAGSSVAQAVQDVAAPAFTPPPRATSTPVPSPALGPAPASVPTSASPALAQGPVYVVQVGSFRSLDQAIAMAARVERAGLKGGIFKLFGDNGSGWFAVRAGGVYTDRGEAARNSDAVAATLRLTPMLRRIGADLLVSRAVAY